MFHRHVCMDVLLCVYEKLRRMGGSQGFYLLGQFAFKTAQYRLDELLRFGRETFSAEVVSLSMSNSWQCLRGIVKISRH